MFGIFRKKKATPVLDQAEILRLGSFADELNAKGNYIEAIGAYSKVIETMNAAGVVDAYFLGKSVLGMLLAHVRAGNIEGAHALWTSDSESLLGFGIYALENTSQQFHGNDIGLYYLICAYLHAYAGGEEGEKAVFSYLNMFTNYANQSEKEIKALAANHWFIDTLILSGFRTENKYEKVLSQIFAKLGSAEVTAITSLVKPQDDGVSFNQRGLAKYFPDQTIWESGDAAMTFNPDGTIKAG